MNRRMHAWTMAVAVAGVFAALAAARATPVSDAMPPILPAGSEPQPMPSPVRWEGDKVRFGDVVLETATKTVVMTGWVNQTDGPIEVMVCGEKGKVHEAVLVAPVNALDFQSACLLAGMKGGKPMPEFGMGPPDGSPVDIFVEWEADGETKRARAESFAWNVETQAPVPDGPWTFNGSMFKDGEFKAFAEESLVVTYWDPYAVINISSPVGRNDEILEANPRAIPPYGTPVKILLRPADVGAPATVPAGDGAGESGGAASIEAPPSE